MHLEKKKTGMGLSGSLLVQQARLTGLTCKIVMVVFNAELLAQVTQKIVCGLAVGDPQSYLKLRWHDNISTTRLNIVCNCRPDALIVGGSMTACTHSMSSIFC